MDLTATLDAKSTYEEEDFVVIAAPTKYYGIAAAGKCVLAVLEKESEIRCIIEETNGGLCSELGDYKSVAKNLQCFIENAGTGEVVAMGERSRENLVQNLTRDVSVKKYAEEILKL